MLSHQLKKLRTLILLKFQLTLKVPPEEMVVVVEIVKIKLLAFVTSEKLIFLYVVLPVKSNAPVDPATV